MPIRSTGCLACRRRKIKCGEERPSCKKCNIHGIACPGYRTSQPGGVEFRNQTYNVVAKVNIDNSRAPGDLRYTNFVDLSHLPAYHGSSPSFELGLAIPKSVNGAALNRMQLISAALHLLLPDWGMSKLPFSYLTAWSTIASAPARRPVLRAAIDTLSLVYVGMTYRDDAMLLEAKRRYGSALLELTRALSQPDVFDDNETLAAITLVEFFELYGPLRQYGSWVSHLRGAESFLVQRGPRPLESITDAILFHQARHTILLYGLVERKPVTFASPAWLDVTKNGFIEDDLTRLIDIVIVAPGLLGRTDQLLASSATGVEAQAVLTELVEVLQRLENWLVNFQGSLGDEPYTLRDVTYFKTFNDHVKDDKTFTSAYLYPSFVAAYLHVYHWLFLAALQKAVLDILSSRSDLTCPWTEDCLRSELLQHIIDICLTIPFLCEPRCGYAGKIATTVSLNSAMFFFRARHMDIQEQWCAKIARSMYCPSYGVMPVWMDDWNPGIMRTIGV